MCVRQGSQLSNTEINKGRVTRVGMGNKTHPPTMVKHFYRGGGYVLGPPAIPLQGVLRRQLHQILFGLTMSFHEL